MKKSFAVEESRCELVFHGLRPCWHLYTPENYPVFFTEEADYKTGMILIALCSLCFPKVIVLTFQWMSNHLHMVVSGPAEDIARLFEMLKKYLGLYLKRRSVRMEDWEPRLREIEDLKDIRNAIAYNNRNGFIVHPDATPFSYPWGANRYFFNPEAVLRFRGCKEVIHQMTLRQLFHTHFFDGLVGTPFMDGVIPPPAFCDIPTAESLFRNAHHYFTLVSRGVEEMKGIADQIGESIFYSDDDLFSAVCKISRDQFGHDRPSTLPAQAKLEVARRMHYDYNAGARQISRILKIDISALGNLMPVNTKNERFGGR